MNSFDVFDTLIARRSITTHEVWKRMAIEFNIPDFDQVRPLPDDGSLSFDGIYEQLITRGYITSDIKDALMKREIELEIENSFGIQENLDRVEDGDLLISDMYLPAAVILQMVRDAGLNKQVTIYQSNADKGNGKVWRELNFKPIIHLGDNPHTDYNQPRAHGFNAELYKGSEFTEVEEYLSKNKFQQIARLCREIRLTNSPVTPPTTGYFRLSSQINLPLLFVIIEQLKRSIGERPIVFLGRDCQLMWRLYNGYFGTAYYLPFSRKVAYTQSTLAAEYLKKHSPENSVIVDISSTGETWTHMAKYGRFNVKSVIYSDSEERNYLPDTFSYITKNSICGQTNLVLEIMNCGDHGHLDSLGQLGNGFISAVFAEPELSFEMIQSIHTPVYDAVDLTSFYKESIVEELKAKTDEELASMFNMLSSTISKQTIMLNSLPEFTKKEDTYHRQILEIRKQFK